MRYVLGVVGVVIILILAIILIVTRSPGGTQEGDKVVTLSEYADKQGQVIYSARGRISADETFRTIRISVDRRERVFEVLSGYQERIENRLVFQNNDEAYEQFIMALDKAGFTRERATSIEDKTGACPLGQLYTYELEENRDEVSSLWSTSCGRNGSFGGDPAIVRQLFQLQIPEYNVLTRDVILY